MNRRARTRVGIGTAAILLGVTIAAQAGPPLICHPLDIGAARTLPAVGWNDVAGSGYDLKNLVHDTLEILNPATPVLVRMETLRRATIYTRQDPPVAKELLVRLHERAVNSDAAGHPDALAWFDAGYLAEAYKEWMRQGTNPASGLDGYAQVERAIRLRGSDAEMEFAAALITLRNSGRNPGDHAQRAVEGAKSDPLLARNLAATFDHHTLSALLTSPETK